MTDFADHSEALVRLQGELEKLIAGRETIAEYGRVAKIALESADGISTANQQLAERIALTAEQLERTSSLVESQFNALNNLVSATAQDYQVVLSNLKQVDVIDKITSTEAQLGSTRYTMLEKFLEVVQLLQTQAEYAVELQRVQVQLVSLTTQLQEQLGSQAADMSAIRDEFRQADISLRSANADAFQKLIDLNEELRQALRTQEQAIAAAANKAGERAENVHTRFSSAEAISLGIQSQVIDQTSQVRRLSEQLGETQREQIELRKEMEKVRTSAKSSTNFSTITMVAQLGLLVLFIVLLLVLRSGAIQ